VVTEGGEETAGQDLWAALPHRFGLPHPPDLTHVSPGTGTCPPTSWGFAEAEVAACVQGGQEALVACSGPSLVGLGERGACGRAHAAGGERFGWGGHRSHHRAPTVASSPLGEDQGPERAPPTEHSAGTSSALAVVQ
jgi:hypothetical protein